MSTLCLVICWPICARQIRAIPWRTGEPCGVIAQRIMPTALRSHLWDPWP